MSLMAKLRSHTLPFSQYLIDYTGQPYSLWEEITQEWEYQEMRNIEGPMGGWLTQLLKHLSLVWVRLVSISSPTRPVFLILFFMITPLWSLFSHVFPNFMLPSWNVNVSLCTVCISVLDIYVYVYTHTHI